MPSQSTESLNLHDESLIKEEKRLTMDAKNKLQGLLFNPSTTYQLLLTKGFEKKSVINYIKELVITLTLRELKFSDFEESLNIPMGDALFGFNTESFRLTLLKNLKTCLNENILLLLKSHPWITQIISDPDGSININDAFSAADTGIETIDTLVKYILRDVNPLEQSDFSRTFASSYSTALAPIASKNAAVFNGDTLSVLFTLSEDFNESYRKYLLTELQKFSDSNIVNAYMALLLEKSRNSASFNPQARERFSSYYDTIKLKYSSNIALLKEAIFSSSYTSATISSKNSPDNEIFRSNISIQEILKRSNPNLAVKEVYKQLKL